MAVSPTNGFTWHYDFGLDAPLYSKILKIPSSNVFAWTDRLVTLEWLQGNPKPIPWTAAKLPVLEITPQDGREDAVQPVFSMKYPRGQSQCMKVGRGSWWEVVIMWSIFNGNRKWVLRDLNVIKALPIRTHNNNVKWSHSGASVKGEPPGGQPSIISTDGWEGEIEPKYLCVKL